MSRSENRERQEYEEIIQHLKNRRVPNRPELISCGQEAKRIHEKVAKELEKVINKKENLTTLVVVGGFGSGKTHLVHLIKNDLFIISRIQS